ncbi:hypothetical protein G7085_03010 [Tessaracoccus sp. HDW20]|uniref:hypothetical protein n=1 Tax=Tessaracoccus coleopterorum TaxID=2714950 RepID=UPI0018D4D0F0|nr:hypothetical protein [Tessaracoccus coleopterorum]NHB83979.1 hypothetical protein [Tessaracoccus coleopterorum]
MIWLLLLLTAVLLLVLELLVDGLEQPGWAIAPLSLVFVMTALIVTEDLPVTDLIP